MDVSMSMRESASGSAAYRASNCSGVMIVNGFFGTVGIFTPLHGWRKVTLSFRAVVKMPDRMAFSVRMFAGLSPCRWTRVIHSRTLDGMISFIRIGPNHGMMCLRICPV